METFRVDDSSKHSRAQTPGVLARGWKSKPETYEGRRLLSQCRHLPPWCLTLISKLLKYSWCLQKISGPVWAEAALLSKHPDLGYSVLLFLCLSLLLNFLHCSSPAAWLMFPGVILPLTSRFKQNSGWFAYSSSRFMSRRRRHRERWQLKEVVWGSFTARGGAGRGERLSILVVS